MRLEAARWLPEVRAGSDDDDGHRVTPWCLEGGDGGGGDCRRAGPSDALVASIGPFDGDVEVVALALERVHAPVELPEAHDAVEVGGVVVVVEDQVAAGRPVADVPGGCRARARGEGSGLLDAVVVAEAEGERQLVGEIVRGGVVGEPAGEVRVAE